MKIWNSNINPEVKDKSEMKDSKAEELEARGLYRRAAQRWLEVMLMSHDRNDQDKARQKHNERGGSTNANTNGSQFKGWKRLQRAPRFPKKI